MSTLYLTANLNPAAAKSQAQYTNGEGVLEWKFYGLGWTKLLPFLQ